MIAPFLCVLAVARVSVQAAPFRAAPFPAKITNGVCPSGEEQAEIRQQIVSEVRALDLHRGLTEDSPASSCSDVLYSSSGYYWIRPTTGPPAVQVYCDFDQGSGVWTRVAFLNMSDPNQDCPGDWVLNKSLPIRTCGMELNNGSCSSAIFRTFELTYNRVYGRILGYQQGATLAFKGLVSGHTIDNAYVDGVSITHGSEGSRQHVWSFASALGDANQLFPSTTDTIDPTDSPDPVGSTSGDNHFDTTTDPGVSGASGDNHYDI